MSAFIPAFKGLPLRTSLFRTFAAHEIVFRYIFKQNIQNMSSVFGVFVDFGFDILLMVAFGILPRYTYYARIGIVSIPWFRRLRHVIPSADPFAPAFTAFAE
jgi:hypothetical protein